ncbi:MAG: radical SAM protein [Elusimicrobiota bacterium]|jgi:radical SAM superfamily enzyme YgiQ (UPF0313 family)
MKPGITLINCFSGNPVPPDAPPYGLLYVGSALKRAGYPVRIVDRHLDQGQSVDALCRSLLNGDEEQLFGLGGVASAYKDALEIAVRLKELKPRCRIVAGGYIGSTAHLLLLKAPIDAVVRGEGEITTLELLDALLEGRPLAGVHGLIHVRDGTVVSTPARPQIADLDEIPFPDYSLVDLPRYLIPAAKAPYFRFDPRARRYSGVVVDLKTARGCTHACSFCYRHMRGMRHHSPRYVLNHMKHLQEFCGADLFNISDELTISSKEWVDEFCELKKQGGPDVLFRITSARVDIITEDMLAKLKDAGMVGVNFGIESGSQRILDAMRKHTTVEQNLNALRLCRKLGIQTTIPLVVGLPEETFHSIFETIRFLIACPHNPTNQDNEYDDANDIRVFSPVAFPGTTIYKQGLKRGVIGNEHEYLLSLNHNLVMRSYNFTDYPDFVRKIWIKALNMTYKGLYFWDEGDYIGLLRFLCKTPFTLLRIMKGGL